MTVIDFPEDFKGAGPMFAAVPYREGFSLLAKGVTTYDVYERDAEGYAIPENPHVFLDEDDAEFAASGRGGLYVVHLGLDTPQVRGTPGYVAAHLGTVVPSGAMPSEEPEAGS